MSDLKTLALAAKGWKLDTVIPATDEKLCEVGTTLDDEFYPLLTLECEDYYKDSVPLANFFVAVSPDVVLGLLEERDFAKYNEDTWYNRFMEAAHKSHELQGELAVMQAERDRLREALQELTDYTYEKSYCGGLKNTACRCNTDCPIVAVIGRARQALEEAR